MSATLRLTPHFAWQLCREAFDHFLEDYALRLSAALAYYSVFSLTPLLLIAISIGSAFFGEAAVRGELAGQLQLYLGAPMADGVQALLKSATAQGANGFAAAIGFATLLVGASGVFGQLKDALNTVWEVKTKPGRGVAAFIRDRLLSFGMVLVIGLLLLTSLLVSTLLTALSDYTRAYLSVPDAVWKVAACAVSFAVSTALFTAIFKFLPDVRLPWRTVFAGSLATAVLFEIGKFALAFYLGRESTASSFGAAGSVVLVLLWVYYTAGILLLGAELTRAYARATDVRVTPDRFAEPVTSATRAREAPEIGTDPASESSEPTPCKHSRVN